jgi:hypothetical protein
MSVMFTGFPDSIGTDCCGEEHGDWQFKNVSEPRHGRADTTWLCSGCGHIAHSEAYRDELNRWVYVDPDQNIIEPTATGRPRRR